MSRIAYVSFIDEDALLADLCGDAEGGVTVLLSKVQQCVQ